MQLLYKATNAICTCPTVVMSSLLNHDYRNLVKTIQPYATYVIIGLST